MPPSPGQTLRAAFLQLTRVLGLAFACVVAGVFAGPWTAPQSLPSPDEQVVPISGHDLPAIECAETQAPTPSEEVEDEEETVVAHCSHPPLHRAHLRDTARDHDAVGPPTRALDVETPPPRR